MPLKFRNDNPRGGGEEEEEELLVRQLIRINFRIHLQSRKIQIGKLGLDTNNRQTGQNTIIRRSGGVREQVLTEARKKQESGMFV